MAIPTMMRNKEPMTSRIIAQTGIRRDDVLTVF
jgi:hypothetical protein